MWTEGDTEMQSTDGGKALLGNETGSKWSKGEPIHLTQDPEINMWPVSTARTEPRGSDAKAADAQEFLHLGFLCDEAYTSVRTDNIIIKHLTAPISSPVLTGQTICLTSKSQNPSCFVFIFLTWEVTALVIHLESFILLFLLTFDNKMLPLPVHSCYTCGIILLLSAPISTN